MRNKRPLTHRLYSLPLLGLVCLSLLVLFQAKPVAADEKESVVEIYNQDKQLIGTGTSISFSGLILTAKHVLEDRSEAGSRSPNYLLEVMIRRHQSAEYEPAELLALHPYMDLAILLDRFGKPIPPLPIAGLKGLKEHDTVKIIGMGQSHEELYKIIMAGIDQVDRGGHIVIGRGVVKGTSGGPVIYQHRLIGVVRNSAIEETKAVPVQAAWDYFNLMGVELTEEGLAIKTPHIGELASRAGKYEEILLDIQTDVNWFVEMRPIRDEGSDPTLFPKDVALRVWYEKKLSTQPSFDTFISMEVTPLFSGKTFESLPLEKRKSFPHSGWLFAKDGMLELINLGKDIEVAAQRDYSQFGINPEDFIGFDIAGQIDSIQGQGFVGTPEKYNVCFSLRLDDSSKLLQHSVLFKGFRCPEGKPGIR
jgi:hypothetical protein